MDILNFLMQSLGGAGGPEEEEGQYDPNEQIRVMGARNQEVPRPNSQGPSYGDPAPREEITPRYVLNDDRMAPTKGELKEIIPRSQGYFGSKGTLRDILGGISDAFLVQGGQKAKYEELRDRERQGDAMFGFADNPMQAMERLAAAGYTKEAGDLYKDHNTNEYQQGNLASQDAGRKSQANDRNFDNKDKGLNRIARWTAGGIPYPQIVAAAKSYGIPEEELNGMGITADMTPEQRRQIGTLDMTVNQQMQIPFTERKVKATEMNAGSQRINATRPRAQPQPRQPRSQTELEYFQAIDGKPAAQRTEGEKDFYTKYTKGTRGNSGKSTTRREVTPPPRAGWSVKLKQ